MNDQAACLQCNSPAVTFIRYSGTHLCSRHFQQFLLKRVKKELRAQDALQGVKKLGVALSGGKDSIVALKCLAEIAGEHRDITIEAVIIDEGITGYRPSSIKIAREVCSKLGLKLHEVAFKDITGMDLDTMTKELDGINPCAVCGVFRRYALNQAAREIGADKLATGHNLDDLAQSVLMNVLNADMDKLRRLGPHKRTIEGLIPRFYPLRSVPEKEILLYALLNELPLHAQECPYASSATRGRYREVLSQLESDNPGTRHSLLNFHKSLVEDCQWSGGRGPQLHCENCKEPSASKKCKRCQYMELVDKALTGTGTE